MKNVSFKECNVVYAKDQPEYRTLEAYTDGTVTVTCYKLSLLERLNVLVSGKVWLAQMNFGNPLQPQLPTVKKNDLI